MLSKSISFFASLAVKTSNYSPLITSCRKIKLTNECYFANQHIAEIKGFLEKLSFSKYLKQFAILCLCSSPQFPKRNHKTIERSHVKFKAISSISAAAFLLTNCSVALKSEESKIPDASSQRIEKGSDNASSASSESGANTSNVQPTEQNSTAQAPSHSEQQNQVTEGSSNAPTNKQEVHSKDESGAPKPVAAPTASVCVPKFEGNQFPSQTEIDEMGKMAAEQHTIKTEVVDGNSHFSMRIVPPVAKPGQIVRVVSIPKADNCNRYRRWSNSCDLNSPLCAKYFDKYVFNTFGGISSVNIPNLADAELIGLEIRVRSTQEIIYSRAAKDGVPEESPFVENNPFKDFYFKAPTSKPSTANIGWTGENAEYEGLSEAQYKALPVCQKQNNKNFSPDYMLISVWQIKPTLTLEQPKFHTASAGSYNFGYASAEYTIIPGKKEERENSCY